MDTQTTTPPENALIGRLDALIERLDKPAPAAPPPPPPAPKEYTRPELQAMVDAGTLSELDRDAILREQDKRKLKAEVVSEVRAETAAEARTRRLAAEIARYKEAVPELATKQGEPWARVLREFKELTEVAGLSPDDLGTELAALRAAFGPADKVVRAVEGGKREAHEEITAGSGGEVPAKGKGGDGMPAGLSDREREFYGKQVASGRMTWKDVGDVLQAFGVPERRRRNGARV